MSMKVSMKNIGVLEKAEFSLGDLTIICGANNTGKTYATYALYGFLHSWRQHLRVRVDDSLVSTLLRDGGVVVNLGQYVEEAANSVSQACRRFTRRLDSFFAAPQSRFRKSEFQIELGPLRIQEKEHRRERGTARGLLFSCLKEEGSEELTVTMLVERDRRRKIIPYTAENFIRENIIEVVFSELFPKPFIASAERTGVAIFRKELNFARNRLLEEMARADRNVDPRNLLFKAYQSYPQPIEDNADFIRQLEDIARNESFIAEEHSELLEDFARIIGGNYSISQNDQLYYIPKGKRLKLTMDASSSSVRSLLDIGFYLRHVAQQGDLLIVDEPELNLHPENQRLIAKLFARLVNIGVKVFVTTHSDYIVKELNTLIMLNHDKPHLKRIIEENGYRSAELIKSNQVKVYVAQADPSEKGQGGYTLVPADIDPVLGIEARSFDETIDDMNRILEDIVWGAE